MDLAIALRAVFSNCTRVVVVPVKVLSLTDEFTEPQEANCLKIQEIGTSASITEVTLPTGYAVVNIKYRYIIKY